MSLLYKPTASRFDKQNALLQSDAGWTWFNKPRAVRDITAEQTYVGSLNSAGDAVISSVDHATGATNTTTLHSGLGEDDHNNPAVLMLDDGRILTAYQDHGQSDTVYYRVSSNPNDISSFDAEQSLSAAGSTSTYAQLAQLSSEGAIYLFYRDEQSDGNSIAFFRSTDGTSTWSGPIDLIKPSSGREYWRIGANDSDRIDIGLTYAAGGGSDPHEDIKHVYLQNQAVYASDGTQLASFTDSEPLITHADATMVFDTAATGNDAWIWDATANDGNPQIGYAELVSSTNHNWRYARWNGSQWVDNPITSAGGRITASGNVEGYYSAGLALEPAADGVVYLSTGRQFQNQIHRYESADGGSSWSSSQVSDIAGENIRPAVPRDIVNGASDAVPAVWMRGYYRYFMTDDFGTSVVTYPSGGVVEDFSTDLSNYVGDTGSFSRVSSPVFQGSNALSSTLSSDTTVELIDDGTLGTISPPAQFAFYSYFPSSLVSQVTHGVFFGLQSQTTGADGYLAQVDDRPSQSDSLVKLYKRSGGTFNVVQSTSLGSAQPKDAWVRTVVTWREDGSFGIEHVDQNENRMGGFSVTDTSFSSGKFGFRRGNYSSDQQTIYLDGVNRHR